MSAIGGLVSSASAVASAASLAPNETIGPTTAGVGAIAASLASAGVNIVLVARLTTERRLILRIRRALALVLVLCPVGAVLQTRIEPLLLR